MTTYSFLPLTEATLRDFVSVRNPDPEAGYSQALAALADGRLELPNRRLFLADGKPLAALTRAPVPRPIYRLKAEPDLTERDVPPLLSFAKTLSETGGPATLNYTAQTSPDFSALALGRGWTLEAQRPRLPHRPERQGRPGGRPRRPDVPGRALFERGFPGVLPACLDARR